MCSLSVSFCKNETLRSKAKLQQRRHWRIWFYNWTAPEFHWSRANGAVNRYTCVLHVVSARCLDSRTG
ncbi:hypothetical protein INR49_004114 [Caranx melampygus]|nr:hypothetical protein INR49_004114 [Caranx melampygus]